MKKLPLLAILLLALTSLQAQNTKWNIRWDKNDISDVETLRQEQYFNGKNHFILHFEQIPNSIERKELESKGIELLGYTGDGHYWASILTNSIDATLLDQSAIRTVSIPTSSFKLNPLLEPARSMDYLMPLTIRLWSSNHVAPFLEELEGDNDIEFLHANSSRGLINVMLKGSAIERINMHPAVSYVGPQPITGRPLLDDAINMNRVNQLQNTTSFGEGLSGRNINVGVWDGGLTGNHDDINGNVTNVEKTFISTLESEHPTHVTGIIGGKGHIDRRVIGMAPSVHMYTWLFDGDIIQEMKDGILEYDLSIINSSFYISYYNDPIVETICQFPGFYVQESSDLDKMVRDNPTLTHVIANGNQNPDCQGAGGWSGIPIGLQSSKNVINVGWLDQYENFYGGSSVGPTYDGRLKPEVMSKGAAVRAPRLGNRYQDVFGSSMSAPAVAGSIALLYEWHNDIHGTDPDAALIRSIICNTAEDLLFEGPDYLFGYGRINGLKALNALENDQYVMDAVSNAEEKTYSIVVPSGVHKLNVAIAWTDKEALPAAAKALVNDLDIKITAPDAGVHLPWTLDPQVPFIAAVTGRDSINNIEQVSINTPAAGTYTVTVSGNEVPFGPQEFSITYDFLTEGIAITHPVGGEQWVPGERQFVRWDGYGTGADVDIDISYNNGASWRDVGLISPPQSFKTYTVGDTTSHECRVRVRSGGYESISGPFTIMRRVSSVFADECDRHITMRWNPVRDADNYIIYRLEDNEYVSLDTITDTMFVMSNLENGTDYRMSVQARQGSDAALWSTGFRLQPQPENCDFTDDIGVYDLCSPLGFRYAFDGGLPYADNVQLIVKNYSSNAISGFNVCYQRSGELPVCEAFPGTLAAHSIDTFTFMATESFTDTISYDYQFWTDLSGDPNRLNDTLAEVIKVVTSHPLPLPYFTGFEAGVQQSYLSKKFALDGLEEWDFYASGTEGRLSVGRQEQLAYEGSLAITLDKATGVDTQKNEAILNLNLNGYQDSTIYLDVAFAEHFEEYEPGDRIWARADDSEAWVEIYEFGIDRSNFRYSLLEAINITKALIVDAGQTFGSHFQIKFGQEGAKSTVFIQGNDGRSFDNVSVYSVGEDLGLRNIDIQSFYCDSLSGSIPVTITVRNNSQQDAINSMIGFSASSGQSHSEVIPLIPADDSIEITLSQEIDYVPGQVIELDVYVSHDKDRYAENDSINDIIIAIRPFAGDNYYESFEDVTNEYFAYGSNSTWDRGVPSNVIINGAASGSNAWVTNLAGRHNNSERSYLLLPCFNFINFTDDPNIAFNLKLEIEEDFDLLSVEYSENGLNWLPLVDSPESYNWFNGGGDYWDVNIEEWTATSNNLDLSSLTDISSVMFRAVMESDEIYKEEGAGLDDLHVTMNKGPVAALADGTVVGPESLTVSPGANHWFPVTGEIGLSLIASSSENADVGVVKESASIFPGGNYAIKRHFWLESAQANTVRLYLPYAEYEVFHADFSYWNAPSQMSVLAYGGINVDEDEGNNSTSYSLIDEELIIKPYSNGYILEFEWIGAGEFYIVTDSAMVIEENVDVAYLSATAVDPTEGLVEWGTTAENNIDGFIVKAGEDGIVYDSIGYVLAAGTDSTTADYTWTDSTYEKACLMYYSVCAVTASGDSIEVGVDTASFVFPGLVETDSLELTVELSDDVTISWMTHQEKCNDRFDVLVSTNGVDYNLLGSVSSMGENTSPTLYSYLDDSTVKEDSICYILEQYNVDGSVATFGPVCVFFEADESLTVGDVTATAIDPDNGSVEWNTLSEVGIAGFVIKVGDDGIIYDSIGYVSATGAENDPAAYSFIDDMTEKECLMFYKVCALTNTGAVIDAGMDTASFVFPSLVLTDSLQASILINDDVEISWGTQSEQCNDFFEVFVSINGGMDMSLGTVTSAGDSDSWTPYSFVDDSTPKSDTLCYTLVQYMTDGFESFYGPECVIFQSDTTAMQIVDTDITDVSCSGGSDGSIDITIENGTPPYTIRWSDGSVTEDIFGIPAGSYVVYIEDALGETVQSSLLVVTEPLPLTINGGTIDDVTCNGAGNGSVSGVTISGGTPPYSYEWSDGSTDVENSNLTPGIHQLTVTDDNGCSSLSSIYLIQEPIAISLTSVVITNAACIAESSGAIDIEVGGGSAPYSYLWSNGAITEDVSGLAAGIYSCVITDNSSCNYTTELFSVGQATAIQIPNVSINDVSCSGGNDGSVNITVTGGTPPYSYLWSNGAVDQDVNMLTAGDYELTITDAAGCVYTPSVFQVTEPAELQISLLEITDLSCNGQSDGAIDIEVTGGSPPYSYAWNNGATTASISDVPAGIYNAVITDSHGCSLTTGAVEVSQPETLSIDVLVTDVTCFEGDDGAIAVQVDGGTPPYTYSWSNGSDTEDLVGLSAGSYILTITDDEECEFISEPIAVGQAEEITAHSSTAVTNPPCYFPETSGSIDLVITGGTSPYSYLWSNGDTVEFISGLQEGSYECAITDVNGCAGMAGPFQIERPEPIELNFLEVIDVACAGESTGSVYVEASGEYPPFNYLWNDNGNLINVQNLVNYPAGTYEMVVTDQNNCPLDAVITAVITEPLTELMIDIASTPESGSGALDGSATVTIAGGDGPYIIHWSNGGSTEEILGLSAGEYCVEVIDANDCALAVCTDVGLGTFVSDIPGMAGLSLYPNPASSEAVLKMIFEEPTVTNIRIIDMQGRILDNLSGNSELVQEIRIDVNDLAAGTYIIKVIADSGNMSIPLVIQH